MAAGYVIYDGPSMIDGERIVVIVAGLNGSRNAKTGNMVQTYVLRPDMTPVEAVKTGADVSICGDCVHRGDGTGKGRSCYVTLIHGPLAVYKAYLRGNYHPATPEAAAEAVAGRMVRLGAYGDPAAAPIEIWQALVSKASAFTGYTHRWRTAEPAWAKLCMASVDNTVELRQATARGWRTFRVGGALTADEIVCPASAEAGKRTQCADCKLCMGTTSRSPKGIQIAPHGAGAGHYKEAA